MGWNKLNAVQDHVVLDGIGPEADVYFVHSYHFVIKQRSDLLATCHYGGEITAMIAKENMIGTQFHPEKSQAVGLRLISNFLRWTP